MLYLSVGTWLILWRRYILKCMEHFPQEQHTDFDPELLPLFEAANETITKYQKNIKNRELIGRELRERAIGHGLDPIEFGQQFWLWKKEAGN
jgi:hypothetical protein